MLGILMYFFPFSAYRKLNIERKLLEEGMWKTLRVLHFMSYRDDVGIKRILIYFSTILFSVNLNFGILFEEKIQIVQNF